MARRCLVEVVRSPDLLPEDMFLQAAFLAHKLDLIAEWYFLMDKVVLEQDCYWHGMICSMFHHDCYDLGIEILLYTAGLVPRSPHWEMIFAMLRGVPLEELFVEE